MNITVPWAALTDQPGAPADVAGFGLVDAADARDLAAAAARDPRTRWCVTALHPDGTAAAHGCAAGRHPPPGTGDVTATPGPDPPPGIRPEDWIGRLHIKMTPIARGTCGHDHARWPARPRRRPARRRYGGRDREQADASLQRGEPEGELQELGQHEQRPE